MNDTKPVNNCACGEPLVSNGFDGKGQSWKPCVKCCRKADQMEKDIKEFCVEHHCALSHMVDQNCSLVSCPFHKYGFWKAEGKG